MNNRLKIAAAGLLVAAITAVAVLAPGTSRPAQAEPLNILGLNSASCVALGSAFGHLSITDAANDCGTLQDQNGVTAGFQLMLRCLRGTFNDGVHTCISTSDILQASPQDFAAMDLDKNQIHNGQDLLVLAFVRNDAPVRFYTDVGQFVDFQGNLIGNNQFCETPDPGAPPRTGDPDCDGNYGTQGDGVVVARIRVDASTPFGTGHVTAIQNAIGFPMDFSVVGPPRTIKIEPLFGKDTISVGATPGLGLPTDCTFSASVAGVLGAIGRAEETVLIVKALDIDGNEVAGALLDWDHTFGSTTEAPQGGVVLPATPTLDLGGTFGVGFPQFVCGGRFTGDLKLKAVLDNALDTHRDPNASASVTIHVLGPPVSIALTADPATIDCNGTNTSTVTARVTTPDGSDVANGTQVDFLVLALGTANPIHTTTTDGKATTTITPFSGENKGVTVNAFAGVDLTLFATATQNTLVTCSGAPPAPPPAPEAGAPGAAPGGGAAPASAGPTGAIRGPETGSGPLDGGGRGSLSWWPLLGLTAAAVALATVRLAVARRRP